MRALEPLGANLDSLRWQGAKLCLLAMLDQMAKQMLVLKARDEWGKGEWWAGGQGGAGRGLASGKQARPAQLPDTTRREVSFVYAGLCFVQDAMVADLLSFLEDVEGAGRSIPARLGGCGSALAAAGLGPGGGPTVRSEARAIRAMLLKMTD